MARPMKIIHRDSTIFRSWLYPKRLSLLRLSGRKAAMKLNRAAFVTSLFAILAITLSPGSEGRAEGYPSRPITIVAPFAAGGPLDTIARILSERMRALLGQPVIIENVIGAGGSIGTGRAVRAAPDGYTISIGNWGT